MVLRKILRLILRFLEVFDITWLHRFVHKQSKDKEGKLETQVDAKTVEWTDVGSCLHKDCGKGTDDGSKSLHEIAQAIEPFTTIGNINL